MKLKNTSIEIEAGKRRKQEAKEAENNPPKRTSSERGLSDHASLLKPIRTPVGHQISEITWLGCWLQEVHGCI